MATNYITGNSAAEPIEQLRQCGREWRNRLMSDTLEEMPNGALRSTARGVKGENLAIVGGELELADSYSMAQ